MSKFIRVTKIDSEYRQSVCGPRFMEAKTILLVNTDHIVSVEDNVIHLADFKIRVAESLEQIHQQIIANDNDS